MINLSQTSQKLSSPVIHHFDRFYEITLTFWLLFALGFRALSYADANKCIAYICWFTVQPEGKIKRMHFEYRLVDLVLLMARVDLALSRIKVIKLVRSCLIMKTPWSIKKQ